MPMTLEGRLADRSSWQPEDCSIAKAMDAIGSRSAMLLLREAFYGTTRFDDFAERVGITDAVAASRLKQLVRLGILEKRPYREPGARTRHEYLLTKMGEDLLPVLLALMQWGDKHLQHDGGPLNVVEHSTGEPIAVEPRGTSRRGLAAEDIELTVNRAWVDKPDTPTPTT